MARDRKLTHEERVLWRKVALSTNPLPERAGDELLSAGEAASADDLAAGVSGMAIRSKRQPEPSLPAPAAKPSSALNHIERPVMRKIARGRLALQARLDLHGMVQAEAHDLLHAFLLRAHERGLRHVLVITGKGSSIGSEGVLKRAVPQWLAKPGFRRLVSGYETAARGHGGEGALYIRLKRRRGEEA